MTGGQRRAFEYIVVGGCIGNASTYWLSRTAGSEVLGIEQFGLGHERGGSEDHSRTIRLSYHDAAGTTLTPHTYEVTVDARTFGPNPRNLSNVRGFLERYIPRYLGPELYTKTCLYGMLPDRDFVLGTVPGDPRFAFFCGAGHAFKFAGLVGKIPAEIAVAGRTRYPIGAFSPDRPALTDPEYEPTLMM